MKYKGYSGVVEFDEDSGVLFGQVVGLRDVITFQGESVAEVIQAVHDSVDDYLEFCEVRGESPEKPYSGQFVLRVDKALHRKLANEAEQKKKSLNALIEGSLASAFPVDAPDAKKASQATKKTKPSRSPGKEHGDVMPKRLGKTGLKGEAGLKDKGTAGAAYMRKPVPKK